MSALVHKEIKLLQGAWIAALLAATMPLWVRADYAEVAPMVLVATMLALALSTFGQETSRGTFSFMLVQPIERLRFWKIKTRLLALALVSVWGVGALCLLPKPLQRPDVWSGWLSGSAFMTFLAFSGGLWSVLLLRDIVAAFLCAIAAPGLIVAVTALTAGHWIPPESDLFAVIVFAILTVYGVAGIFFARHLFLQAEDAPWAATQISLSVGQAVSLRWLGFTLKSKQNRWVALVKKELQLQQAVMFLIPLLIVLDLIIWAAYAFHAQNDTIHGVALDMIPIIWIYAIPLVIGCTSVAEERRLRTMEGQLCLPISKLEQFLVKFGVVITLAIVLGAILPWLQFQMRSGKDLDFFAACGIATLIAGIAFYASTLIGTLLEAILISVCIPVLAGMVAAIYANFILHPTGYFYFSGRLFSILAWPSFTIVGLLLAYKNFRRLQFGWQVWLGDLAKIGAAAGCVTLASAGIYNRAWEFFLPLEPKHGPARLIGTVRPCIANSPDYLYVLLPDGRLWVGQKQWIGRDRATLNFVPRGFAPGSNWASLAADGPKAAAAAIRSDGTLWQTITGADLHQIGTDADWTKITGNGGVFLAVKQNGTLWGWGDDRSGILDNATNGIATRVHPHKPSHTVLPTHAGTAVSGSGYDAQLLAGPAYAPVTSPIRLGIESNWLDAFLCSAVNNGNDRLKATGVKRDGTTWNWGFVFFETDRMAFNLSARIPISLKIRSKLDGSNWLAMAGSPQLTLAVRGDGTLWAIGRTGPNIFGGDLPSDWNVNPTRVGDKTDWVTIKGQWEFAALEADGTFWAMRWDKCLRPSKYSDWIAACDDEPLTWVLAKDGTLSCWDEFVLRYYAPAFLGLSRRPVYSANILDNPKGNFIFSADVAKSEFALKAKQTNHQP